MQRDIINENSIEYVLGEILCNNKYQITIKASGNVAGVCANNNGIISSCYFYNSSIITNNSINNIVSGFVLNNNTNASIYLISNLFPFGKGEKFFDFFL